MSVHSKKGPVSVTAVRRLKGERPIVTLTCYTTPMAKQLDPHVDILLVGDSLGMVLYGMDSTLGVTLDMMIAHGRAVVRGAEHACVIVDMPFASYQEGPDQAFRNCARVMAETGCAGVKLEGGEVMAETAAFLTERGIPVMGHVGLTPQSVHQLGGFKVQGRDLSGAEQIMRDAHAIAEAGAFSLVIESTVASLAKSVTKALPIPTIGIGASVDCDGQVLVTEDLLGLFNDFTPRFVKRYANLGQMVSEAASAYAEDVVARRFPGPEHSFEG
ncbi:MAG: 3-methyl-2-oxobutanoate hydroxymethyltransferase [Pseudomonadota bacterium]